MKIRYAALTAAFLLSLTASVALAQAPAAVPSAPAPHAEPPAAPTDPLPKAELKYFTATTPTVDTVNAFLKAVWGFDTNRLYRVMAIQPTSAPGVVKVTVFVTSKEPGAKVQAATFYVTPDGKHAISEGSGVVPFGATPFADLREMLRTRADGAWRGAPGKDFELVEFADLQCPHCKEAQATVDQIVHDFPNAHVVFQLFPLIEIHPSAFKAAAYATCAQKQGNDAFFKFTAGVFDTQEGLSPATDDALLKAAAKRAGLDADAIAACAATPATKEAVTADIKLAQDAGIDQTPLLVANGRILPLSSNATTPEDKAKFYDEIKKLIQFQADLDGVKSGATAETLAPTIPQPTLQTLPK